MRVMLVMSVMKVMRVMRVMRDGIRLWGLGGLGGLMKAEQASRAGHTLKKKNYSKFFFPIVNFFFIFFNENVFFGLYPHMGLLNIHYTRDTHIKH